MKLVLTGAAGMLGTDLHRVGERRGHEVVALTRTDLDVTDADAASRRFLQERPEAVVNCAAYTDVDGAEDDLPEAMKLNADAARNVAAAADDAGAVVVYPSTDYVFDGSKHEPYLESDEPRPQSVYGQSKLAGEHETEIATARHLIVRTSWLFGTAGKNFVETMLFLAREHGEVSVVEDQVGCPTYTGHLAEGILELLERGTTGLRHLAGGGHCTWFEFAEEIFRQTELDPLMRPSTTAELGRPAPRPAFSVLGTEYHDVTLPHWREGLAAYLAERPVRA